MQITLVVLTIACIARVSSRATSVTQIGDDKVYDDGEFLHCGTLLCQGKDLICIIGKKTNENNGTQIIDCTMCVDSERQIVAADKQCVVNSNRKENVTYYIYIPSGNGSYEVMSINLNAFVDGVGKMFKALSEIIRKLISDSVLTSIS